MLISLQVGRALSNRSSYVGRATSPYAASDWEAGVEISYLSHGSC